MKKITLFVIILICSLFNFFCKGLLAPLTTASSLAATYFIDATGGNDANDGLTVDTAWQTLGKVNSYPFTPGENIFFKRGERWRGTLKIPSSGTAGMPIVFGAYGDEALPRPIIDATTALTDNWNFLGDNLYSHYWQIDANLLSYLKPSVLVYGGEPMPPVYTLTFAGLTVVPTPNDILKQAPWQTMIVTSADINANTVSGLSIYDTWDTTHPVIALSGTIDPSGASPIDVTPKLSSLTEPGHWYWHDNTLYLYSVDPPENVGVEVVSQQYAIDSKQNDYITIQDLAVRGGTSAGVILEYNTDHAILRNLLVYDTGMLNWGAGITVWGANDNTISDNEVRSTLKTGILCTAWNGPLTTGNNISGNYIHDIGGIGVRLDSANASNNIIEYNTIGYANQLNFDSAGIHLQGSGTGNMIRFNEIFNGGSSTMKSAGIMADGNPAAIRFYYNLIYGNNNGGIDLTGSGHEVYNNTLYHNDESQWNAGEIDFFPVNNVGVSNCTVKNNIIVASDDKYLFTVNNWGYDSTQGHDIDYNFYMGNTAYPFIWGDQVKNFDDWKALSEQDAHSFKTPAMGLNNPPIDFELTSNSPAIDAGTDVGLSYDFAGKPVPQNNFVDIGALEYPISGNIALSSAAYSVAEDGVSATIYVTRTAGPEGAVSIDYTTSDGTALAGSDYTAASGTLSWGDGDIQDKSFTITILGDALVESDETVNIALTNPTGGAFLGTPNTAVLTITDTSTTTTQPTTTTTSTTTTTLPSTTTTTLPSVPSTTTTTIPGSGGGGGGGGGGGIFGDIIRSQVIGYHPDGYTESGIQIYMPVTKGFKALKGAQEYIRSFAPDLARKVREFFDYLEQKADADEEGLLYQTGTHIFPILGKIAKGGLELIGEGKYINDAYSKTTISIEEFKKLEGRGFAIAPKVVKDFQNQERLFTDMVY